MRNLLLLPLLLIFTVPAQNPAPNPDGSAVVVLTYKWTKSRQVIEKLDPVAGPTPAPAMIPDNKNYAKNARMNNPVGARDPNEDTLDGRSAALEKINQEARNAPTGKPVDGYTYRVKVQNSSAKVIEILFWEYQFVDSANPAIVTRRQFLCGVNVRPDSKKELQAFAVTGPSDVVSVGSLANNSGNTFQEKIIINRVEYADGTIWQRKDWNFGEIRMAYRRAVGTPWGTEMCRGL
jgi:hypothetical protein